MEISGLGLGFINTIAIHAGKEQSSAGNRDFSGFFAGSMLLAGNTAENTNKNKDKMLTAEEVTELLQFLNTDEIVDVEDGLALLDNVVSNPDRNLLSIMTEYLHPSDDRLQAEFASLLEKQTSKEDLPEPDGDELLAPIIGANVQEALIALFNDLPMFQTDYRKNTAVDGNFAEIEKAVKLYNLLSAYQGSATNQSQLKQLLNNIKELLENISNQSNPARRMDLLQQIFTPLVRGLNQQNAKNHDFSSEEKLKGTIKTDLVNGGLFQFQPISKPEQMSLMLDKASRPVSTGQLIEQFESILSKSYFLKTGSGQKLFIKLNPDHLGMLRVELIQKEATMVARILTTTAAAKDVLDSQLQGLKHAFSSQNIQVDRIEISQQVNQQERLFKEHQQENHQRHQQPKQDDNRQEEKKFTNSFEETLMNTEV